MDGFEQVKARKVELIAELARVDDILARFKALSLEALETLNGHASKAGPSTPRKRRAVADDTRKRGPNGSSPEEITAAAKLAIREAGKPLTRFELIPLIEAKGPKIGGIDKARNLGTILWRSKEFENGGDGYSPLGNDSAIV